MIFRGAAALILLLASTIAAADPVAVTFDDLPLNGELAPTMLFGPEKSYCLTLLFTVTVPEEIAVAKLTVVWDAVSSKVGVAPAKKLDAMP